MNEINPSNDKAEKRFDFPIGSVLPAEDGKMVFLCLRAGKSCGLFFPAEVLQAALPLFDGVPCFMDADPIVTGTYSERKYAGKLSDSLWDEELQGIRARMMPFSPAAVKLRQICDEILESEGLDTVPGFSLDLGFREEDGVVTGITGIYGLSLLFDPDMGGAVLLALNAIADRNADASLSNQIRAESAAIRRLQLVMKRLSAGTQLNEV